MKPPMWTAFSDSFAGADGVETVVHEYGVRATIDAGTLRVAS